MNSYGLPLLSYRIKDLAETNDVDIQYAASPRQVRIMSLIRQQLEQNIENLYRLAEHLKRSILFYESIRSVNIICILHGSIQIANMKMWKHQ